MIVFRWMLRVPAEDVIVCRLGRYTTEKTHNDPDVWPGLLRMVTVRTLTPVALDVGHLVDEDHGVGGRVKARGEKQATWCMIAPRSPRDERPQQDSNLRTRLRRPMLYPLSYGGSLTQKCYQPGAALVTLARDARGDAGRTRSAAMASTCLRR